MLSSNASDFKKAEKLVKQGKIAAAIKEYKNLVAINPNDFTLANTLGDLCVREGKIEEAVENFTRIGESYLKNGFNLKAIAMFKKIYKLSSANPEVSYKLAELYLQQGLIVDARKQYLEVVDIYTRSGRTQMAHDVLRKVVDIDPGNIPVRLRLAESYQQEKMDEQAHDLYVATGLQLLRSNKLEEAQDVLLKALDIVKNSKPATVALVDIFIQQNQIDKATLLLSNVRQTNPDDPDLIVLAGRIHFANDALDKASEHFIKLLQLDKKQFEPLLQVISKQIGLFEFDKAIKLINICMDSLLVNHQESHLIKALEQIVQLDQTSIGALKALVTIYGRVEDEHNLTQVLNKLVEAATHNQDTETATMALKKLIELYPNEHSYDQRLKMLNSGKLTNTTPLIPQNTSPLSKVNQYSINFETGTPLQQVSPKTDTFIEIDISDGFSEYTDTGSQPWEVHHHQLDNFYAGAPHPTSTDFAKQMPVNSFPNFDILSNDVHSVPSAKNTVTGELKTSKLFNEDLESVDFYLSQGYIDLAKDLLARLSAQFPNNFDVQQRFTQLNLVMQKSESSSQNNLESISPDNAFNVTKEPNKHFNQLIQTPIASIDRSISSSTDSAEVRSDISSVEMQQESLAQTTGSLLQDIFDEFKHSIESETEEKLDFETHYNLGLAYKDMELFDEAIEAFQTAMRTTMDDLSDIKYFQSCNMLGLCFLSKTMPQAAAIWFKRGLEAPGRNEDEYQAMRFNLALALEEQGKQSAALEIFETVYAMDINYRDVGKKIKHIKECLNVVAKSA